MQIEFKESFGEYELIKNTPRISQAFVQSPECSLLILSKKGFFDCVTCD